jgi:hypothetical protein
MAACKTCVNSRVLSENASIKTFACDFFGTLPSPIQNAGCMNYEAIGEKHKDKIKPLNKPTEKRNKIYTKLFKDISQEIFKIKDQKLKSLIEKGNKILKDDEKIRINFWADRDSFKIYMSIAFYSYALLNVLEDDIKKVDGVIHLSRSYKSHKDDYGEEYAKSVFMVEDQWIAGQIQTMTAEETCIILHDMDDDDEDMGYTGDDYVRCNLCRRDVKLKNAKKHLFATHSIDLDEKSEWLDEDIYDYITFI